MVVFVKKNNNDDAKKAVDGNNESFKNIDSKVYISKQKTEIKKLLDGGKSASSSSSKLCYSSIKDSSYKNIYEYYKDGYKISAVCENTSAGHQVCGGLLKSMPKIEVTYSNDPCAGAY